MESGDIVEFPQLLRVLISHNHTDGISFFSLCKRWEPVHSEGFILFSPINYRCGVAIWQSAPLSTISIPLARAVRRVGRRKLRSIHFFSQLSAAIGPSTQNFFIAGSVSGHFRSRVPLSLAFSTQVLLNTI